jgi:hypothetical protein
MKVCPDSGGAHHFHADASGVRMCSCGVIEMAPADEMAMVEMTALPPLPADRARSLYTRLSGVLGLSEEDVDDIVDSVERPAQ